MNTFFEFLFIVRIIAMFTMLLLTFFTWRSKSKFLKEYLTCFILMILFHFLIPKEQINDLLQLGEPFINFPSLRSIAFNIAFFAVFGAFLFFVRKR